VTDELLAEGRGGYLATSGQLNGAIWDANPGTKLKLIWAGPFYGRFEAGRWQSKMAKRQEKHRSHRRSWESMERAFFYSEP